MGDSGCGFSKEERLRKRREFLGVYERGDKVQANYLVLYLLENRLPYNRLGITVSRKIGRSVVRNRLKRLLREIFRANKHAFTPHCDLVVNAKRAAANVYTQQIQEDFLNAIGRWRHKG